MKAEMLYIILTLIGIGCFCIGTDMILLLLKRFLDDRLALIVLYPVPTNFLAISLLL